MLQYNIIINHNKNCKVLVHPVTAAATGWNLLLLTSNEQVCSNDNTSELCQNVSGFNTGQDTGSHDKSFSWFSFKIPVNSVILKLDHYYCFLPNPSISLFSSHSAIWYCTLWNIDRWRGIPGLNWLCTMSWRHMGAGSTDQGIMISEHDGSEWSVSHSCHFTSWETAFGTNSVGIWMCPRAGAKFMNERKILSLNQESNPNSLMIQPTV